MAARQHGVVARRQLLEAGVSAQQIKVRLRGGRLHEVHRGVYLVGHVVPPPYAREQAALLACGPAAVLSHRSAAALWGLLSYPPTAPVRLTLPPGRSADRPGLAIHRLCLEGRDTRRRHGLPLTSPPRTILDLAAELARAALERLVAEAAYRRLAGEGELRDQLARNPRKHGAPALRAVLDLPGGPRRTRSPAERAMLRLLRRAGFNGYETNARIGGYEVDILWRDLQLAVEVDGYEAHSGRVAFERDRLKIATLKARGVDVMPVTGRQIRDDPDGVAARLRRAVAAARRMRPGGREAFP